MFLRHVSITLHGLSKKGVLHIRKGKNGEVLKHHSWGCPTIFQQTTKMFDGFNPKCAVSKVLNPTMMFEDCGKQYVYMPLKSTRLCSRWSARLFLLYTCIIILKQLDLILSANVSIVHRVSTPGSISVSISRSISMCINIYIYTYISLYTYTCIYGRYLQHILLSKAIQLGSPTPTAAPMP